MINDVCFNSAYMRELDANFTTTYINEKDDFIYSIDRLCGFTSNKLEKSWSFYINQIKFDWNKICSDNLIISYMDSVEFRYE